MYIHVDRTARTPPYRQIEDALRRSDAYYRVLTTAAQDHIFVINRDDRVEYVNQAAADQLRSTPDKIIEGSPQNSTSTVPIMPWGTLPAPASTTVSTG